MPLFLSFKMCGRASVHPLSLMGLSFCRAIFSINLWTVYHHRSLLVLRHCKRAAITTIYSICSWCLRFFIRCLKRSDLGLVHFCSSHFPWLLDVIKPIIACWYSNGKSCNDSHNHLLSALQVILRSYLVHLALLAVLSIPRVALLAQTTNR